MNSQRVLEDTVYFGTGALGYGMMEISCRGYTHPSMLLAGGLCFLTIRGFSGLRRSFPIKCALGAATITSVEFLFGCVFNLALHMKVWDYSDQPLNIFGQICPKFLLIWYAVSAGGFLLSKCMDRALKKPVFKGSKKARLQNIRPVLSALKR